jgi:hypothetical protein
VIAVTNLVRVYEIDGKELTGPKNDIRLSVHSHWNERQFIVIEIEGKRYTVVAYDLETAIKNASNVGNR